MFLFGAIVHRTGDSSPRLGMTRTGGFSYFTTREGLLAWTPAIATERSIGLEAYLLIDGQTVRGGGQYSHSVTLATGFAQGMDGQGRADAHSLCLMQRCHMMDRHHPGGVKKPDGCDWFSVKPSQVSAPGTVGIYTFDAASNDWVRSDQIEAAASFGR